MEINSSNISNNSLESFSEADLDFKPPIMKSNTFAKLNLNNLNISQELENCSEISSIDINEPQITPTNNNNKFLKEIIPSESNNNKNKKHKKLNKEDLNNTPLPIFSCIYCSNENVSFSHLSREILSEKYLFLTSIYDMNLMQRLINTPLICTDSNLHDKTIKLIINYSEYLKEYYNKSKIINFFQNEKFKKNIFDKNKILIKNNFKNRLEFSITRKKNELNFKDIKCIQKTSNNKNLFNSTNSWINNVKDFNSICDDNNNILNNNKNTYSMNSSLNFNSLSLNNNTDYITINNNNNNNNNNNINNNNNNINIINNYNNVNNNNININNNNNNNNNSNNNNNLKQININSIGMDSIVEKIENNCEEDEEDNDFLGFLRFDLKRKINHNDISWEEKSFNIWDPVFIDINEDDDENSINNNKSSSNNNYDNKENIFLNKTQNSVKYNIRNKNINSNKKISYNNISNNSNSNINNNNNNSFINVSSKSSNLMNFKKNTLPVSKKNILKEINMNNSNKELIKLSFNILNPNTTKNFNNNNNNINENNSKSNIIINNKNFYNIKENFDNNQTYLLFKKNLTSKSLKNIHNKYKNNNNNNNIDNNSNFNSYNNIYDLNLNKNYQTRHRHNKTLDKILDFYVSEFSVKGNNSSTQNDTIEKSSFLNKNISKELGQSSFNLNSFNNNSNNNNSNYSNYVPFKKINSFNNLIPKKYNINNKKIKKQVEDLYDLINYNTSQERQRKYFDRKVNSIFSPNNIHQNNMRIKKINLYNCNKKNNYNFFDNI